ncbi:MAG TPA: PilZ domain-containing protein [Desulfosporosinus sp.]|nr:PilZ domain-containing protein [Desulfosporosinus sp.]
MSYKNKLSVGLTVGIVVPDGEYKGRYRSNIEEVGEKLLTVGAPFERGNLVPLREGTKLKLTFCDETSAYTFEAEIMQRIAVPLPMLVLELPDSIAKVQRRNFVRVPAVYPVTFRMVTREGISDIYTGTMLDLSGGGMRFLVEEQIDNKSLIYVHLTLPNEDLQTPARVTRVQKIEDSKRYVVSVEFHDLSERERDRIIRCVFEIQRAIRKKGLV